MNIKTISDSISKAYRQEPISKSEIQSFRQSLCTFYNSISKQSKERNLETYLREFLRSTFYFNNDINKPDNSDIDWAVRIGNKETPVGIIIENKSLRNKSEMITKEDLNRKAMHELIYYYLEERIEHNNTDIRHLIANNMYEFFIFDGQDFDKYFYQNKSLVKEYKDFKSGQKVRKDTSFFYEDIASKYVKDVQDLIPFTFFDLQKYKHSIESSSEDDLKKLAPLYRIFSDIHLLKKPFKNDNNSLNDKFYKELLHILGLEEAKENGKKTIIRRLPEDRTNPASLIELTITQIRKKLYKLTDRKKYGNSDSEQLYNIALELCITWINRILFLKLLESQLIKYHHDDESYRFLTIEKISDFDLLNYLFFDVLAIDYEKRDEYNIRHEFEKVPYLNSSLFEETYLEEKLININALMQSEQLPLANQSVLKKAGSPYEKSRKLPTLEYLFAFLDAYNFSSEGNDDEIREEPKTLISASVLGLIFEKINGHKDGAVFTPGYITMYMSHEAIRRTIIQKFNSTYNWHCSNETELWNRLDSIEISEANNVINSIKICDPAVGSGHFLVSALNEIICAKYDLGILVDKEGKKIKKQNYLIEIDKDELIVSNIDEGESELFSYQPGIPEKQRIQETLFNEKRLIIENCLFGVDINPNSVNICRLRLWIELLKNAYYTEESGYKYLETLPNIDINIKCGNSVISKYPLNASMNSSASIKKYKSAVTEYKQTSNKEKKYEIDEIIREIKAQISAGLRKEDKDFKALTRLEKRYYELTDSLSEDIFGYSKKQIRERNKEIKKLKDEIAVKRAIVEEKKNNIAFQGLNAFEWRFEFPEVLDDNGNFTGFDCIIGNPPYGLINKKQNKDEAIVVSENALDLYKNSPQFAPAQGGMLNIFRLFVVQSVYLLKPNGIFSEIFPLAFACDISSHKLRRFIIDNCSIISLEAFPERDNVQKRVFENAKMSVCILNMINKHNEECKFNLRINSNKYIDYSIMPGTISYGDLIKMDEQYLTIPLSDCKSLAIVKKIYDESDYFQSYGKCNTGEIDMTFCKEAFTKNTNDSVMIRGANIDRYVIKNTMSQGETFYLNDELLTQTKKIDDSLFTTTRLVLQGITGVNEKRRLKVAIMENAYCANSVNYCTFSRDVNKYFFLGLLNSNLINFVFKQFSTNSNVNGYEVDNLPIIYDENSTISELAMKILDETDLHQREKLENNIDFETYLLYKLTYEEVLVIDPFTPISRESFEKEFNKRQINN